MKYQNDKPQFCAAYSFNGGKTQSMVCAVTMNDLRLTWAFITRIDLDESKVGVFDGFTTRKPTPEELAQ